MKVIKAKIIDSKHLELEEPLSGKIGQVIEVVLAENKDNSWKDKAKNHFFKMYSEEDSIYDEV